MKLFLKKLLFIWILHETFLPILKKMKNMYFFQNRKFGLKKAYLRIFIFKILYHFAENLRPFPGLEKNFFEKKISHKNLYRTYFRNVTFSFTFR